MSFETIDYIDTEGNKVIAIELTSGECSGLIYSYGAVSFPDQDEPILQFEYTLHEGVVSDNEKFKNIIGDILVEIIEESVKNKDTIFAGGI